MPAPRKPPTRASKPKAAAARTAGLVRDRRGQVALSVTAAELKNRTGAVLIGTLSHGTVAITRHGEIHAVLVSFDEYQALLKHAPAPAKALEKEFTQLLAKMRTKRSLRGALSLFRVAPEELGHAAHQAARREGRRRTRS